MAPQDARTLQDVFDLLGRWRHLPYYRLEPRVAPFFALFLRDILHSRLNVELHPVVVPEFPLRLGTLDRSNLSSTGSDDQSVKVDYAAFSEDCKRAFFVELKTDDGSVELEQEKYLRAARQADFGGLIDGVIRICNVSNKKQKYVHLLHQLSELGFVSVDDQLYDKSFRAFGDGPTRAVAGWTGAHELTKNTVRGGGITTEIVYIKPTTGKSDKEDFQYIDFDQVADSIRERGELGGMFAECLRRWQVKAGSEDPRDRTAVT